MSIKDEQLRDKIFNLCVTYNGVINDDVLQFIVDELKEEGVPYLTERGNEVLKDLLGFNEDGVPKTSFEISEKLGVTVSSVNEVGRRNATQLCTRVSFVDALSKSDPCLDLYVIYKAVSKLSFKTINSLIRSNVKRVSDFMSIDRDTIGRVWYLGTVALSEIEVAQDLINNPDKVVDDGIVSTKDVTATKRELQINKLFVLMKNKQKLQNQLSEIDDEINMLLNSINDEEEFIHGIK